MSHNHSHASHDHSDHSHHSHQSHSPAPTPKAQPSTSKKTDIIFTQAAATKVFALIQEEDNPNLKLRVYISGGGCSGFQYGFTFDEEVREDDQVITTKIQPTAAAHATSTPPATETTVVLLIDCMSYQYLVGAEIDYREDINGAQFIIRNPNAKTTCGCGSSFSVGDAEGT